VWRTVFVWMAGTSVGLSRATCSRRTLLGRADNRHLSAPRCAPSRRVQPQGPIPVWRGLARGGHACQVHYNSFANPTPQSPLYWGDSTLVNARALCDACRRGEPRVSVTIGGAVPENAGSDGRRSRSYAGKRPKTSCEVRRPAIRMEVQAALVGKRPSCRRALVGHDTESPR